MGKSSTSRMFNIMRTHENLTYGAYALYVGGEAGYPPFLQCWSLLPNDVFIKGRDMMRTIVKDFAECGVTTTEVKEEQDSENSSPMALQDCKAWGKKSCNNSCRAAGFSKSLSCKFDTITKLRYCTCVN